MLVPNSFEFFIWCNDQDQYLINQIKQVVQGLKIKRVLNNQDILTFQQKYPIIFLSTAMDRSIQSNYKHNYYKLSQRKLSNVFFRIQIKNKSARYYESIFQQASKIILRKSFILELSFTKQNRLCFKSESEKKMCRNIFGQINCQISKISESIYFIKQLQQQSRSGQKFQDDRKLQQVKGCIQAHKSLNQLQQKLCQQLKKSQEKQTKQTNQTKYLREKIQLESQINKIKKQLQRFNTFDLKQGSMHDKIKLSFMQNEIKQNKEEIETLKTSDQKLKNQVIDMQDEQQRLLNENHKKQEFIIILKTKIEELTQEIQKIKQKNNSTYKVYENDIDKKNKQIQNCQKELKKANQKIKQLQSNIQKSKQAYMSLENRNKNQIERLKRQQQKKSKLDIQRLNNQYAQLVKMFDSTNSLVKNLSSQNISLKLQNNRLKNNQNIIQDRFKNLETKTESHQSKLNKLNQHISVSQKNQNFNDLQNNIKKSNNNYINNINKPEIKNINISSKPWYLIANISPTQQICKEIHRELKGESIPVNQRIYSLNNQINLQKDDKVIFLNMSNGQKIIRTSTNIENIIHQIKSSLTIVQIKQKISQNQKYKQNKYAFCENNKKTMNFTIPMKENSFKKKELQKRFFYGHSTDFTRLLDHLKKIQKL